MPAQTLQNGHNGHVKSSEEIESPHVDVTNGSDSIEDEEEDGVEDLGDDGPEKKRKRFKRSSRACTYCQHLKMKCSGTQPCERCTRTGKQCKLPVKNARKPWTRRKDLQIEALTSRLEEMEQKLANTSNNQNDGAATTTNGSANLFESQNLPISPPWSISALNSSVSGGSSLLQLPFVSTGKMTSAEAIALHDSFMHNCPVHVPLLDPEYHTIWRTSTNSPFLFACIINVAANYHMARPELRLELKDEMDGLIGRIITSGEKNIGIIQGFLLLYFWNQPCSEHGKDLAWTYSGLAMRMAVDLSIHNPTSTTETELERIDRERTWMFCYLVDRTQSAARGKKWSLHGDDPIIQNAASWYSQPICRVWDLGISALADLLNVTSRQMDVLNNCFLTASELQNSFDCDMIMRVLNEELQQWKLRWKAKGFFTSPTGEDPTYNVQSPASGVTDHVDMHNRILHYLTRQAFLRYHYAVLVLNCAGLQFCSSHPENSSAKTYILTHAIQAARGVVIAAKDGLRYTVAYSPHTQCTILSFAIISLIKMASLKRDDSEVSESLHQLVLSGITFLESSALYPTHVPARFASMLRGLLRRSQQTNHDHTPAAAFRPGMEIHSLPLRSSRAVTPLNNSNGGEGQVNLLRSQHPMSIQQLSSAPSIPSKRAPVITTKDEHNNDYFASTSSGTSPTSFTLFGQEGSTGMGQMTADEILDDSFWLCLPSFYSGTTPNPLA